MYAIDDAAMLRAALHDAAHANQQAAKAMLTLLAEMEQREARMTAAFNQRMHALEDGVSRVENRVAGIVSGAKTQLAEDGKLALAPVAAQFDRDVAATATQLKRANKTVWTWAAIIGGVLLSVAIVAWTVLGYYRRELAKTQAELAHYERVVEVVKAYTASDAAVCDGRLCVNIEPNGKRMGGKRQYRQAKLREQQ